MAANIREKADSRVENRPMRRVRALRVDKFTDAHAAVALVPTAARLGSTGFIGSGAPDALLAALAQRHDTAGEPLDLV